MTKFSFRGKDYKSQDGTLISGTSAFTDSLIADTLAVDTMEVTVQDLDQHPPLMVAADGMLAAADGMLLGYDTVASELEEYIYGELARSFSDDTLLCKHYVESITQVAVNQWQFSCISGVGLLLASDHYGGIYDGMTCGVLIAAIIDGIVPYTITPDLAAEPVFGWLPKAKRRDNLHYVLFAMGAIAEKNEDGDLHFKFQEEKTPYALSSDAIYSGGSVAGLTPATAVSVTEHTFFKASTDVQETLFDGEVAGGDITTPNGVKVTGVILEFKDPVYGLSCSGATILESGANYAVLSISTKAVLAGKKYAHTQRIVRNVLDASGTPNEVTSSDCGLVNSLNSESVVNRLSAYYGAAHSIGIDFVLTDQKPGDAVTFTDPFGRQQSGYIESYDVNFSAILKAHAQISTGYIPGGGGNYFTRVITITAGGTFTVPADCKGKIRIVLISGGNVGITGSPGSAGEDGLSGDGSQSGDRNGGAGGAAGAGGAGGLVYVTTFAVNIGDTFAMTIGTGGTPSQAAGNSTFGSYSSASGTRSDAGYSAVMTGMVYAAKGISGCAGAAGGNTKTGVDPSPSGNNLTYQGKTYYGGSGGAWYRTSTTGGQGGAGGGAAVGTKGGTGAAGSGADGGIGGTGATPVKAANATIPGTGGQGGHGGGGGGAGGAGWDTEWTGWGASGGAGGAGGVGGNGAPGIILVYV